MTVQTFLLSSAHTITTGVGNDVVVCDQAGSIDGEAIADFSALPV